MKPKLRTGPLVKATLSCEGCRYLILTSGCGPDGPETYFSCRKAPKEHLYGFATRSWCPCLNGTMLEISIS